MNLPILGTVELEAVCADIPALLTAINHEGIPLFSSQRIDDLTVIFKLDRKYLRKLRTIALLKGAKLSLHSRSGLYWVLKKLLKRPVLIGGIILLLTLTLLLPRYVLFIQVTGNTSVPAKHIEAAASVSGLRQGSKRRSLRSEEIKNRILAEIPQLQWVGVNTHGCLAVISVREKMQPSADTDAAGISSIIAATDGEIYEMTVTAGTPMCQVGDKVTIGQVLVSGFTDCGSCTRGVRAKAEIYADTNREMEAVTPGTDWLRLEISERNQKFFLILGKKQINFFKGSGISDVGCVKMYQEYSLTLPGGFELPVKLCREETVRYAQEKHAMPLPKATALLQDYLADYVMEQMIAGNILTREETTVRLGDTFITHGNYQCREMIGITRIEETLDNYGKNHREDN